MSYTPQESLEILRAAKEIIPNYKVYYTMKGMKIKHIRTITVEYVKACLALHTFNLAITTNLVEAIMDKENTSTILHGLGDKKILLLKRSDKKSQELEWIIDPIFLKRYEGGIQG